MDLIYVAGPYTKGDVAINIRRAVDAAEIILSQGMIPYVPHWSHFWHMIYEHDWQTWLKIDEALLLRCDAVLRLPGESAGADLEMKMAADHWIPVFLDFDSLEKWHKEKEGASPS
jgi:hypothetical protein